MTFVNKNTELRDVLCAETKRGNWEAVVNNYAENPKAQKLKLTLQGNTALHLAVIDNQEEIVVKLVKLISRSKDDYKELLETTNERENNPLHLAAVMGSVRMCHAIASAHEKLVDMRNKVDETPMFLAATYGNKDAFYCLYYFCRNNHSRITTNCRVNKEGDTVLHFALRNEQIDFAFQLIHMNNDAMNWVNEKGFTPLHVLASKPTSFKSGSHIKGWQKIVYYCAFVDQLKPQSIETLNQKLTQSKCEAKTTPSHFPVNYETCIDFFTRLKDIFLIVSTLKRQTKKKKNNDEAKKDKDLEKYIDGERENFDTDEYHKRLDTGDLKANQSAREPTRTNLPTNYSTCFYFLQIVFSAIMIILGFGSTHIRKIWKKKEKHTWSIQVMEKLFESNEPDTYGEDGRTPMDSRFQTDEAENVTLPYNFVDGEVQFSDDFNKPRELEKPKVVIETQTAMLLAAKNGVIEIVRGLFERFPLTIRHTGKDKKNVVLLAAEYRQPHVYRFLLKKIKLIENLFRAVDHKGNSALHLAATAIDPKLWHITGAALQMQCEVKWYKYVEESVPLHFFGHYNNEGKAASAIFHETHMKLVTKGGEWLYNTSESCSVVATLIATVAFTTAVSIPGGNDDLGGAKLEGEQSFFIFSISSLIALCLSSTSVIMFLAILTSRFETKDFGLVLPWKLLIGLSCLYFSIIAMLISFCSGHYFLTIHRLHNEAILLYTLTFLPVALIFGIVQLPLYFDLLLAILKIVPQRSAGVVPCDLIHTTWYKLKTF